MSYRNPDQSLKDPIDKIISGLEDLDSSIKARLDSDEWKEDHEIELDHLRVDSFKFKTRLEKIARENW